MSEKHVEPAFPTQSEMLGHNAGMTLRDYFAAKALEALIGFPDKMDINRGAHAVPKLAAWAYEYADAMLAERAK